MATATFDTKDLAGADDIDGEENPRVLDEDVSPSSEYGAPTPKTAGALFIPRVEFELGIPDPNATGFDGRVEVGGTMAG